MSKLRQSKMPKKYRSPASFLLMANPMNGYPEFENIMAFKTQCGLLGFLFKYIFLISKRLIPKRGCIAKDNFSAWLHFC